MTNRVSIFPCNVLTEIILKRTPKSTISYVDVFIIRKNIPTQQISSTFPYNLQLNVSYYDMVDAS